MILGIRVSEKQGAIAWKQVKQAGIAYAMLCCGYGEGNRIREDIRIRQNIEACEKFDIPYGIYIYSRAMDLEQAELEAEYTCSLLKGGTPIYPVMVQFEDCDTTLMLKRSQMGAIAQMYCETVQQSGYRPGVCANKYWFTNLLTEPCFDQWDRLVIQHYKECTYAGAYTMWQFTSDGRVSGIAGSVPLIECYKNDWRSREEEFEDEKTVNREPEALPNLTGYVGVSLVGALNVKRYPSDFAFRRGLAVRTGLVRQPSDYRGTPEQNIGLLRSLGGTISVSKIIREGTYIKLKMGSRNINTDKPFDDEVYRNTYQVLAISGVSVIFGVQNTAIGKVNRNSVIVV